MVAQAGTENAAVADTSLPAVYEWLQESGHDSAEMRAFRDAELRLVKETNLTIVVSEQNDLSSNTIFPMRLSILSATLCRQKLRQDFRARSVKASCLWAALGTRLIVAQ